MNDSAVKSVNELLEEASFFEQNGQYGNALRIYREMTVDHPDEINGYIGCLRIQTENFSRENLSRKDITQCREYLEKIRELSDGEYETFAAAAEKYLNCAYDVVQTKLELLESYGSALRARQIATEQLSKRQYMENHSSKTARKIIIIGLMTIFLLIAIGAFVWGVFTAVAIIHLQGRFSFSFITDLMMLICILLTLIFTVMFIVSVASLKKVGREIDELEKDYSRETKERTEEFSLEYDKFQKEYQEILEG